MNALVPAALHGEVLADRVRVLWQPHPFDERQMEVHHLPASASLAEIVEDVCEVDGRQVAPRSLRAWVDGRRVDYDPESGWPVVYAAADVQLRRVPGPPAVVAIIPILAATIGTAAGAAIGGTVLGISAAVIGGAIGSIVGSLAAFGASMLFKPSQSSLKQIDNRAPSPTYSISGIGNTLDRYGVVPLILGTHRIYPPYAAEPNTQLVGSDQWLNCLFIAGYGTVDIAETKIGETPIEQFSDIHISVYNLAAGAALPADVTNFADEEVFNLNLGTSGSPNPGIIRTTSPNTDAISFDLVAPQGVYHVDRNGTTKPHATAPIQIDYRLVGTAPWTTLGNIGLTGAVRGEVVRRGLYWGVPRGQYDVRLTNLGNGALTGDTSYVDEIYWTALRSHQLIQPVTFDDFLTLVHVRIRANDQLSGQLDAFNFVARYRGYGYFGNGVWEWGHHSRNPAAHFRSVLQGHGNKRFVPDFGIDFGSLNAWADECIALGWAYSKVHDYEASVWQVLTDICAAGRAMPVFVDGRWGVIWERLSPAAITQAFTPRNTLGFSGEKNYDVQPHGYRVRFANEQVGYQQDERIVYDDGYSAANATLLEDLPLPGVTHPDLVWRLGRFHIAQRRLRPEIYTIEVDIEQVACRRGDRVRVNHDTPLWGLGFGRVVAISGSVITLDEPVPMEAGKAYVMHFKSVGAGGGHADAMCDIATEAGEQTEVTIIGGTPPSVGDTFMFGEWGASSVVLRVLSIEPGPDLSARVRLVDDALDVLFADQGAIPPFDSNISIRIIRGNQLSPSDLWIAESLVLVEDEPLVEVVFSWDAPPTDGIDRFQVQWRSGAEPTWTRTGERPAEARSFTVRVPPGEWHFRVRAILSPRTDVWLIGGVTQWAQLQHNAGATFATPPNVTNARIVIAGNQATLSWSTVAVGQVRGVQVRHSPLTSGASLANSVLLESRAIGGKVLVPNVTGTYLLRWESYLGIFSATPAAIVNTAGDLTHYNVVETLDEHPDFDGSVFDDLSVNGDELILDGEGVGSYEFDNRIDLGAVYPCRLSISANAFAVNTVTTFFGSGGLSFFGNGNEKFFDVPADSWDIGLEYRATNDDPEGTPTWTDWAPLLLGEVQARAFEFRLTAECTLGDLQVTIDALSATVDMPDRIHPVEDVAVGVGGTTVDFVPPFRALRNVHTTIQGLTAGQQRFVRVTSKGPAGVDVQVVDEAGSAVAATVDVIGVGYGISA